MRLLFVNYEYPPIGGGAATATQQIAQSLAAQGHSVTVLTAAFGQLRGKVVESGVNVVRLPAMRRRADRSSIVEMAAFVASAFWALPKTMSAFRPQAVICFFSIPCGPIGWWAKRRYAIPYLVSLRGGDVPGTEGNLAWVHRLLRPIRRRLLRDANMVVANSEGLKALSESADPFPVAVIPNGVDCLFFKPATDGRTDSAGYRYLFVGRLNDQKNVALLLEAFADVCMRNRDTSLCIIGDGPLRDDLQRYAHHLGLAERVEWLGWQPRAAMPEHYAGADCLINPSRYEGMPNVVLEAMACGLPVVVSDVAGNRDVVQHEKTGWLFPDGDRRALAELMSLVLDSRELRVSIGHRARAAMLDEYSWGATARRYVQALQRSDNEAGNAEAI